MYVTMREIGKLFGVSSHVIGRWLVAIGLRTYDKRPSTEAHHGGYVTQGGLGNGGYFYLWHKEKTVAALEKAEHKQVAQVSAGRMNGPFTARQSGTNGYEIVNGDGTVCVWVWGGKSANDLARLMNFAFGRGWFGGKE